MQRNELLLAIALGALILTGLVYESYRGAGKTAEVIIAHPGITPFDATTAVSISPVSPPSIETAKHTERDRLLLYTLNAASLKQLETLPGIGETIAQRILSTRESLGGFSNPEQIMEVNGIGVSKLETLQEYFQNKIQAAIKNKPNIPPMRPRFLPPPLTSSQVRPGQKIPLNRATREQLLTVPGIGPALADSIMQTKQERNGFSSWDDVDSVSGIGDQRLHEIQRRFSLSTHR